MKIRKGFVSNSSSSSFIVSIKTLISEEDLILISKEDEKKLIEYGFKYSSCYGINTITIEEMSDDSFIEGDHDYISLCYGISCNQEDVICFLLKNNISFAASVHYNHSMLFYEKDSDYVLSLPNYGVEYATYFFTDNKHIQHNFLEIMGKDLKKNITKINKKEYLEEENNIIIKD